MAFNLIQRPAKCLVCSLTYGLPNVFDRLPVIHVKGLVDKAQEKGIRIKTWLFGQTEEISPDLHQIPLYLDLE
jgi:hypothetical protein